MQYRVWFDAFEDEEDAIFMTANDAETAAVKFVNHNLSWFARTAFELGEPITVNVLSSPTSSFNQYTYSAANIVFSPD